MDYATILTLNTKTKRLYEKYCSKICERIGITQSAFDVIMFIANHPNQNTAHDIIKYRGIKSGIVSISVEKLIQLGFLERKQKKSDRRVQFLLLTEKASASVNEGRKIQKRFGEAIAKGISKEDREYANELIHTMLSNVENAEKNLQEK